MKAVVVWVVLLVVILAGYAYKTDPVLSSSCVGPAPSATVTGSRVLRRMGELVNADPHPPAAIKADVEKVLRVLRLLWRSFSFAANGQKVDPEILRLEQADKERRRAAPLCSDALDDETPCPSPDAPPPSGSWDPRLASLQGNPGTAGQRAITATTVRVGQQMGVGERGWVVAVTAGLTETGLRNLPYGDSSSVGVWQLIDSHGTVAQRMNVEWAARWFFRQLKAVNGWEAMPVGEAAQAVEQSGYPGRYAANEGEARRLVASVGAAPPATTPPAECSPAATSPGDTDTRIVWPVPGHVTGTYPGHDGVDINGAAGDGNRDAGDPIRAAAAGTVTHTGTGKGYGQAVFIQTDTGYRTVYGHTSRIDVHVGQRVKAGDLIGAVGSTGHSSAAHLHFGVFPGGTTQAALDFLAGRLPNLTTTKGAGA